jgi:16S rRNA (uracil1498-N3)-methyltransferase
MPRFFIDENNISEQHIYIRGDEARHIRNVLRMKPGDSIILCDGRGMDYISVIEGFEEGMVAALIKETKSSCSEPPIEVTLYQGLPKSDKMDFIIQKSVELGVCRIIPVITERTVVRFKDKKDMEKKKERWQRISHEAAKQCGRGIIPEVSFPVSYDDAVESARGAGLALIPYEKCMDSSLKECLHGSEERSAAVFIGPEGGFSDNEIKKAVSSGIKPVTLGNRILRTETAGLAVLIILMYEKGDI